MGMPVAVDEPAVPQNRSERPQQAQGNQQMRQPEIRMGQTATHVGGGHDAERSGSHRRCGCETPMLTGTVQQRLNTSRTQPSQLQTERRKSETA